MSPRLPFQKYSTSVSLQEGNAEAQLRMLTSIIVKNKPISEGVSRKIYEFVWT